jgi:hypothetical protein
MLERGRLGILGVCLRADIRMAQDVQALGIRRHDAVFDAVVHHLYEMSGAGRTAVQIPPLRGGGSPRCPAGRRRRGIGPRCQRFKNRIQVPHDGRGAADHQAEATIESPDSAACADVDEVNAPGGQFTRPAQIVDVMRVAAVDDDVA